MKSMKDKRQLLSFYEDVNHVSKEQINEWIDELTKAGYTYPITEEKIKQVLKDDK